MSSSSKKPPQLEVAAPSPSDRERPKLNTSRATAHRLPPPALFQGPPSKNASHISLVLPGDRVPGAPPDAEHPPRMHRPARVPAASSFSGPALRQPLADADDRRAESLWAEMQKTLADVEVSAMNTSHVFGASHAKALEDLRAAQLSLAQTWAKTEADELHDHEFNIAAANNNINHININTEVVGQLDTGTSTPVNPSPGLNPSKGTKGTKGTNKGDGNGKRSAFTSNKNLEEETERDIQLARKRREANDRYFKQVNRGVLDVVSKLDEVAGAMRRVERESREIWDESSDSSLSGTESGSVTDHTRPTDSPEPVHKER
ncbi:hypothetical protein A1O3_08318 [Capronia epimyces CBS 606.96]|uniref:Uncharacterized protein n=1 Tax=Capronia epimyces CBS 606.96 TaxID=1182542 RepID=W9XHN1_9EURO|nr:uncharacterized protein A1O3_08318 [Capronia epimyces CBS 606.96]EXJ80032.1 hypothetical protein A1O3_08318 [Capronia epimyces CBS 606.96]